MNYIQISRQYCCYVFCITLFFIASSIQPKTSITSNHIDENTLGIILNIELPPGDFIYKEYIDFSVDHPDIQLSDWHSDSNPVSHYDPSFKETKKIYDKNFAITLNVTKQSSIKAQDAYLHFTHYSHTQKKFIEELFPLSFEQTAQAAISDTVDKHIQVNDQNVLEAKQPHAATTKQQTTSWSTYISTLIETTESTWVRIMLVLLLGMLLSLTPCIYPMIPITAGILQSQGSTSILFNFLLALAYTLGIATTFALLGLMAAFSGQLFGSLLAQPVFVIALVILLAYLALSMFDFYQVYIPTSLQKNNTGMKRGSLISAFLFGAASGTIASPCLSPGLVLLLSVVTTLGSKLLGFMLLFSFGVGLSLPLLIIGTFSSSLNVLPRAGMWMVEIKQLFGFLLLGMCLYFLKTIVPWHIMLWLISLLVIVAGVFYLYSAQYSTASWWRSIKTLLGMALVASSILLIAKSYQATYMNQLTNTSSHTWETNYEYALNRAKKEHKKLLVDVGAPYCSLCKAIDSTLFNNDNVIKALHAVVTVKIDGSDTTNSSSKIVQEQYNIIGFPTILVIDPNTQHVIKQWGGELYEIAAHDFIHELEQLIQS